VTAPEASVNITGVLDSAINNGLMNSLTAENGISVTDLASAVPWPWRLWAKEVLHEDGYLDWVIEPSYSSGTGKNMFQRVLSKRTVIEDASRWFMLLTSCFLPIQVAEVLETRLRLEAQSA
jgi:hypothetical protein